MRQDRGVFDTFPLSLITTQTITRLADMVSTPLDVQRFRPNLLVEATAGAPFAEDTWLACVLRVGSLRLRVDKRGGRCLVITSPGRLHSATPWHAQRRGLCSLGHIAAPFDLALGAPRGVR
jgi:uncharacterized protein YcbX